MRTLEEIKKQMRLCHAVDTNWGKKRDLWIGYACELCRGCCQECGVDFLWFAPELAGYDEVATEEEWLEWTENTKKYIPKKTKNRNNKR